MKNSSSENISEDCSYKDITAQQFTQDENTEEGIILLSKVIDDDANYLVRDYPVSSDGNIKVLGLDIKSYANEEDFKYKSNGPLYFNGDSVLETLSSEKLKEYGHANEEDFKNKSNGLHYLNEDGFLESLTSEELKEYGHINAREEDFKYKSDGPYHLNEDGVIERLLSSKELKEYGHTNEDFKHKSNGLYHLNEDGVIEGLSSSEELKEYDLTTPVEIQDVINKNIQGTSKESSNAKGNSLEIESQLGNIKANNKSRNFFRNPIIQRIKNKFILPLQVAIRKKEESNDTGSKN